jgi:hypothetical protein
MEGKDNNRAEKYLKLLLAQFPNGVDIRVLPNEKFFDEVHIGYGSNLGLFKEIESGHFEAISQDELNQYFK